MLGLIMALMIGLIIVGCVMALACGIGGVLLVILEVAAPIIIIGLIVFAIYKFGKSKGKKNL